jgi:hypothetical protein
VDIQFRVVKIIVPMN